MKARTFKVKSLFGYLLVSAAMVFWMGCQTSKEDKEKEATTLRFYLEVNPEETVRTLSVPVFRRNPQTITIMETPFLDEGHVLQAAVVEDAFGGHQISLQLDRQGSLILENLTTSYPKRRIVMHSMFGDARYIGAWQIQKRITDGILRFTPDATKEESDRIVLGLNHIANELHRTGQ